jgi:HEAT repeat protein
MKRHKILFAVSLLLLLTIPIIPQEIADQNNSAKESCIKTLLEGLQTENRGLQAGCTYMLGELCCDRGVITLLDILHNSPSEELRILAALSLYKIGDSRGIYAIKQSIKYDESERVSRLCEKFYRAYVQKESNESVDIALK